MPPPPLVDDLIEEVLLRLPPDYPLTLLRAALVCRAWRRLVSNRRFRRRFREFHRSPLMLGFFHRSQDATTGFIPVSPFLPPHAGCPSPTTSSWIPIDARHGRVLFYDSEELELAVLNPITGEARMLPVPRFPHAYCGWSAALACVAAGCGHLHCPFAGPFVVVCLATSKPDGVTSACIYSSEAAEWTHVSSVQHPRGSLLLPHSAFARNALYFLFERRGRILEYDLGRHELSVIAPPPVNRTGCAALVTANGGRLGFGIVDRKLKLHTWYKESAGPNGWVQHRVVIDLKSLLPVWALSCSPLIVAFPNGADAIFLWTDGIGIFSIDLKSGLVMEVDATGELHWIVPYRSFYTPALDVASTGDEGWRVDTSSALQT